LTAGPKAPPFFYVLLSLSANYRRACIVEETGMALRIELKPGERILIGESVLINHDQRATFLIEGSAPILREKDIMTPDRADTPAKRIYLAVQLMYTSRDPRTHHDVYFALMRDIVQAAPSTWPYVESINNRILTGDLYKALKEAKNLVLYEQELLQNA
jgi:flagellar protein FlbT